MSGTGRSSKRSAASTLRGAHALRQGHGLEGATTFSLHQDTEDEEGIDFDNLFTCTCSVKLTADAGLPSRMRVVGYEPFVYDEDRGSAALFLSDAWHVSIAPSEDTAYSEKLVFFFKPVSADLRARQRIERGQLKAIEGANDLSLRQEWAGCVALYTEAIEAEAGGQGERGTLPDRATETPWHRSLLFSRALASLELRRPGDALADADALDARGESEGATAIRHLVRQHIAGEDRVSFFLSVCRASLLRERTHEGCRCTHSHGWRRRAVRQRSVAAGLGRAATIVPGRGGRTNPRPRSLLFSRALASPCGPRS